MDRILKEHRKSILTAVVFVLLAVLMWLRQSADSHTEILTREKPGGSVRQEQIICQTGDGVTQELELEIHPQEYSEQETEEYVRQAVSLWEQEYLGENDSEKAIYEALKLPDTMMDGMVTVSYESSEYDILHEDGSVSLESVPDEGILVELQATFTCQKYIQTEIRSLQVILPPKGSRAWFQVQVARAIEKAEQSSRKAPEVQLPEQIAGSTISWMKPKSKEWMAVLLVGTCVVFVLEWREKERKRQAEKQRQRKLQREYPQLVEQLALLIGSGMTIRRAWERILWMEERMQKVRGSQTHLFQAEMQITYQEMQKGCGEKEAYERFGQRIGMTEYRRLSSLLARNLEKGTRNLCDLLSAESQEAWENRKFQAKKQGEEAGMKLLFPMLLLFVLILIILLYPAINKF